MLSSLRKTEFGFFYIVLIVLNIAYPIILLIWDVKRLNYRRLLKKEEIDANRQQELQYAEEMEHYTNRKKSSTELGTITGYEPKELEKIQIVSTSLMRGNPGAGLSGSGFNQGNIDMGVKGELGFAKVLQKDHLLDKFATYWSVQYPHIFLAGPDRSSKGDIDCVLITKNHVYLIDLKYYRQGDLTWTKINNRNQIVAVDNATGDWIGEPYYMSRNMRHATSTIRRKMKRLDIKLKVKPYVVMMPTDRGLGKVADNVFWPGKVQCLTLVDFLKVIENEKPFDTEAIDTVVLDSVFTWLTKDETGQAPSF